MCLSWLVAAGAGQTQCANQFPNIHLPSQQTGTLAGLLGSYLDSVFGASLQFTGFNLNSRKVTSDFDNEDVGRIAGIPLLSNSGVNLLSNAVNSLAIAGMAYAWIL